MRRISLIMAILAGFLAGCEKKAAVTPPAAAEQSSEGGLPTKAQPRLQTIRLWLGAEELITEMALTPEQEQTGMMFRTNMPENTGMIFVLPAPMRASFWMKNCTVPLDAGYIDPEGTLSEVHPLQPQDTNAVVANVNNILYVLEVNQGWFARHHIAPGTMIRSEFGSLPDTFRRRR